VDAEAAARAWVEAWERGWAAKDAEPIAARYAEGARFLSQPFRDWRHGPEGAREYCEHAFAEEGEVEFWFGEPVAGGNRAAVEYWAILVEDGQLVSLAGTAVLRFTPDGLVEEHRDYWAMREGIAERPDGWGR